MTENANYKPFNISQ